MVWLLVEICLKKLINTYFRRAGHTQAKQVGLSIRNSLGGNLGNFSETTTSVHPILYPYDSGYSNREHVSRSAARGCGWMSSRLDVLTHDCCAWVS